MEKPEVLVVRDVVNRNADRSKMAGSPARRHNADLILPELALGMDILKHLHLFLAFGEQALYIAPDRAMGGASPAKP